jgi:hypothetical protein
MNSYMDAMPDPVCDLPTPAQGIACPATFFARACKETLPVSPTLSGEPNMIATPDTVHGTGRRHRVVAIGSGLSGLTATKALKHAQVNITDALPFLMRVTAQGTSHVLNQTPQWLQVIPAAGVAATICVMIALHVAIVRVPRQLLKSADTTKHRWMRSTAPKGNVLRLKLETFWAEPLGASKHTLK